MSNELHFDSDKGAANDPSVQQTRLAIDILTQNPYVFMSHAYYGGGGFRDGTYLVPHTREMFYAKRRQISYYKNFTKPVLRAMVDPVFNEPVTREVSGDNELWQGFMEDVDLNKTILQKFTEETVNKARLHGVTFIVMDNFSDKEQPQSMEEAKKKRAYPYMYIRTADTVKDYEIDRYGRLISITFREMDVKTPKENGQGYEVEEQYRRWTSTSVETLTYKSDGSVQVISTTALTIGMLPVIPVYSVTRPDLSVLLVDPPLFDLARLNATIFNLDTEIRWLERQQAFSFLYLPGDNPGDLTISESNVLWVPKDSPFAPGFASPPMDIHNGLIAAMADLVEHFYRLAEQSGVVGVMRQLSGVSKEWDFRALESILKMSSTMAVSIEKNITTLWNAYTNQSVEVDSDYPWDFGPVSAAEELKTYESVKDVKSDQFKMEIEKKQARLLLSDIETEDFDAVLEDIEKVYEEPEEVIVPQFGNPTGQMGNPEENMMGATGMQGEPNDE
jgi:hypothetical protein